MIPYEELCVALERYAERHHGEAPVHTDETALPPAAHEPSTNEHALPPVSLGASEDEAEDDHTHVGGVQHLAEDHSNELDIGDVLSDEEAHKS